MDGEFAVIVALIRDCAAAGEPTAAEAARLVSHAAFAYVNLAAVEGQRGNLASARRFLDKGHQEGRCGGSSGR
ncbi:MAG: hypothetical protein M3422_06395 [Actinomycetota bacterium]|nr:hypothetical protein [Actinomycetota bacterium]